MAVDGDFEDEALVLRRHGVDLYVFEAHGLQHRQSLPYGNLGENRQWDCARRQGVDAQIDGADGLDVGVWLGVLVNHGSGLELVVVDGVGDRPFESCPLEFCYGLVDRQLPHIGHFLLLSVSREYVDCQKAGIANGPKGQHDENGVGEYGVFCFEVAEKLIVHLKTRLLICGKVNELVKYGKINFVDGKDSAFAKDEDFVYEIGWVVWLFLCLELDSHYLYTYGLKTEYDYERHKSFLWVFLVPLLYKFV